jgi:hypothetical protein
VFLLGAFALLAALVATAGSTPVGVVIGVAGFLIMVAAAVTLLFPASAQPRLIRGGWAPTPGGAGVLVVAVG